MRKETEEELNALRKNILQKKNQALLMHVQENNKDLKKQLTKENTELREKISTQWEGITDQVGEMNDAVEKTKEGNKQLQETLKKALLLLGNTTETLGNLKERNKKIMKQLAQPPGHKKGFFKKLIGQ